MADVEVDGKIFPDRRNGSGSGRLKMSVGDWLKIIGVFVAAVWGYSSLYGMVNNHEKAIVKHSSVIEELETKAVISQTNIASMQADVTVIKQDVKQLLQRVK